MANMGTTQCPKLPCRLDQGQKQSMHMCYWLEYL